MAEPTHLSGGELEIRERVNAATEGPWFFDCKDDVGEGRYQIIQAGGFDNPSCGKSVCETSHHDVIDAGNGLRLDLQHGRIEDARFISKARTDIPLLLDRLDAALRELAARQWISVTERIPEKAKDVLAICASPLTALYDSKQFVGWLDGDGHWYVDAPTYPSITGVTHWQPLPAPPSEHSEGKE